MGIAPRDVLLLLCLANPTMSSSYSMMKIGNSLNGEHLYLRKKNLAFWWSPNISTLAFVFGISGYHKAKNGDRIFGEIQFTNMHLMLLQKLLNHWKSIWFWPIWEHKLGSPCGICKHSVACGLITMLVATAHNMWINYRSSFRPGANMAPYAEEGCKVWQCFWKHLNVW